MRSAAIRSDVHFWKHGRVGDSMVVTDEVWLSHYESLKVTSDLEYSVVPGTSLRERSLKLVRA
jgi:hypothetical protein